MLLSWCVESLWQNLIPYTVESLSLIALGLALSTKELETVWPARSQNNGLGWDITAYPWGGVSVG